VQEAVYASSTPIVQSFGAGRVYHSIIRPSKIFFFFFFFFFFFYIDVIFFFFLFFFFFIFFFKHQTKNHVNRKSCCNLIMALSSQPIGVIVTA